MLISEKVPLDLPPRRRLTRRIHIVRSVMSAAIRERRILSVTYRAAVQPQLFAPVALYVSAASRLMVDGYEVNGKRVWWPNSRSKQRETCGRPSTLILWNRLRRLMARRNRRALPN
jgi:hypothetical protein